VSAYFLGLSNLLFDRTNTMIAANRDIITLTVYPDLQKISLNNGTVSVSASNKVTSAKALLTH